MGWQKSELYHKETSQKADIKYTNVLIIKNTAFKILQDLIGLKDFIDVYIKLIKKQEREGVINIFSHF